jgi:hypothetical protein
VIRGAPLAAGVTATCAALAAGGLLLGQQILGFAGRPPAGDGAPDVEIPLPVVRTAPPPAPWTGGAIAFAVRPAPRLRAVARRAATAVVSAPVASRPATRPVPAVPVRVAHRPVAPRPVAPRPSAPHVTPTGPDSSGHPDLPGREPLSGYTAPDL